MTVSPGAAGKIAWNPGNHVFPTPAALVSCQTPGGKPNLLTVAWCGNINSNPPMLSISLRPERHSHAIIKETGEFVLNLPSRRLARAVDFCGVASGRNLDKFAASGLSPFPVARVSCPGVAECPVNLSCRVTQRVRLGSHDLFLAMIEETMVDFGLMDRNGRFQIEKADLICYAHGFYFTFGKRLGRFGWSVGKVGRKHVYTRTDQKS
ncbi:MAG: flavin reductase family protein [Planctomycetota bacterium]|jgi:flavin reductase (DIM6/NTAB) family NADH-FMN oxidoreductase RutF|nr:flavin reductase family protein [Planctomycetota bacterium]